VPEKRQRPSPRLQTQVQARPESRSCWPRRVVIEPPAPAPAPPCPMGR
jgi:hypothetical protein